jgi:hypothetical protein
MLLFLLAFLTVQFTCSDASWPHSNATCLGNLDFSIPEFADWDPNSYPLQELCLAVGHGGNSPAKNVGGWCDRFEFFYILRQSETSYLRPLAFGLAASIDQINMELYNPRLLFSCQQRCFCNIDTQDLSVKPRGLNIVEQGRSTIDIWRTMAYLIKIDIIDDWNQQATLPTGFSGVAVDCIRSLGSRCVSFFGRFIPTSRHWRRTRFREHFATVHESRTLTQIQTLQWTSMTPLLPIVFDDGNNVTCEGPLPSFPLPGPYSDRDFSTLQQLCAFRGSGGKWLALSRTLIGLDLDLSN